MLTENRDQKGSPEDEGPVAPETLGRSRGREVTSPCPPLGAGDWGALSTCDLPTHLLRLRIGH